jgi:DNA-binding CsgD family transcriptional regulator/pimeloyl-ACP methyl ester carboxylesterase
VADPDPASDLHRAQRARRFIQYDGRGSGRSQRDVSDLSLEGFLLDLDAVVAATRADRFVLLGFYHSATHAIAWAARHPERVRGLVLFGGTLRGWDAMRGPGTQALLSLIERDWDTFVDSVAHAWLGWPAGEEGRLAADWFRKSTTPTIARATFQAAYAIDVTADATRVVCPVLVLHRADATVIPLDLSEELARALPNSRLEVLPGSSASLFFEGADAIVDLLVAFVEDPEGVVTGGADAPHRGRRARGSRALSPRETEVLRLVAAGESNGQIAARLAISINTVERHVTNIYRKLDARGRAEATAWAIRNGIA